MTTTDANKMLEGPDGLNLTSMGNADRFVRDYGDNLRWVEGASRNSGGLFYHWTGERWKQDESKAVLWSQKTVRDLNKLVVMAAKDHKAKLAEICAEWWERCEADHEIREILSLAQRRLVIDRGTFDANPDVLGVKNGVVDLR